jgi:predicted HicB family RNase H-like nuclease
MSTLGKRDRVQLNVWVDRTDHEAAHKLAKLEDRSLSGFLRQLLKSRIAEHEEDAP